MIRILPIGIALVLLAGCGTDREDPARIPGSPAEAPRGGMISNPASNSSAPPATTLGRRSRMQPATTSTPSCWRWRAASSMAYVVPTPGA